jgi:glycosyltransferase involved in cell wall biosynthesis
MTGAAVSVIIPVRNGAQFITEAVQSALVQTQPPQEVIVIDDGSEDDLAAALAPFREKIVLLSQPARGVSAARNAGIAAARGDWLAFLDADDTWQPEKLERQLALVRPQVNLIFSDTSVFGARRQESWLAAHNPQRGQIFEYLLTDNFIWTSSVLARRAAVLTAGGFDESLAQVEDRDLWLRLAAAGEADFVPEPLVRQRSHAGSLMGDREQAEMGLYRVLEKAAQYCPEKYQAAAPAVHKLLAETAQEVGRLRLGAGDIPAARTWFAKSAQYGGRSATLALYRIATYLPRAVRVSLAAGKRAVADKRSENAL